MAASSRPEDEQSYPDVNNLAYTNVLVSFAVKTFAETRHSETPMSAPKISKQEPTIPESQRYHPNTRAPHAAGNLIHGNRDEGQVTCPTAVCSDCDNGMPTRPMANSYFRTELLELLPVLRTSAGDFHVFAKDLLTTDRDMGVISLNASGRESHLVDGGFVLPTPPLHIHQSPARSQR